MNNEPDDEVPFDDNEGIDMEEVTAWLPSPGEYPEGEANLNDPLPNPDDQAIVKGVPDLNTQAPELPPPSTRRPGRFLDNLRRPWSRLKK
jgi:hypothetical protein